MDKLIGVEVITPAGNWSSYPPHKHDETRDDESELEEIYYYLFRSQAPDGVDPGRSIGYQRVYGTTDRPIDVLREVTDGDTVLVPHGWHGPSIALPSHDMYYLNVMAGPSPTAAGRSATIRRTAGSAAPGRTSRPTLGYRSTEPALRTGSHPGRTGRP